ncbi:MAG: class I SAM-dependent methyltransferase, partial [Spirochaetota bacterium]
MKITTLSEMFSDIARYYDFLNHLLSFDRDRLWRTILTSAIHIQKNSHSRKMHNRPNPLRILDACTGTADLAIEMGKRIPNAEITGIDFSTAMMRIGKRKIKSSGLKDRITLIRGNVYRLPFEDGEFDVVTVAFGL